MDPVTDFLTGYVVPAGDGLAGDLGLEVSRHSTGGAVSVFETSIGARPPLHLHDREDECFYVLDGALSVRCGHVAFATAAGSFVSLPRGRPHRFWATGPAARLLLIAIPGGIENYIAEINAASSDASAARSVSVTASARCPDEPAGDGANPGQGRRPGRPGPCLADGRRGRPARAGPRHP
jgi:mannose-6-phosphate isomerase-like protein (cupin superfamily)